MGLRSGWGSAEFSGDWGVPGFPDCPFFHPRLFRVINSVTTNKKGSAVALPFTIQFEDT